MQATRTSPNLPLRRAGFTLIELLVVISIIAALMSLLLPGIQNAREAARRAQCLSQMRNVSMAFQSYATVNHDRLPYLLTDGANTNTIRSVDPLTAAPVGVPWSVQLLPFLEQQQLFNRITSASPSAAGPDSIAQLRKTTVQVFTCPDDPDAERSGTLSQVVNAGLTTRLHWTSALGGASLNSVHIAGENPDGPEYDYSYNCWCTPDAQFPPEELAITRSNGVFWQEWLSGGYRTRLGNFRDGLSHTVLLTENVQATNWWAFNINEIAYVVAMEWGGEGDANASGNFASNELYMNGVGPKPLEPYSLMQNALQYAIDGSGAPYKGINFSGDAELSRARLNSDVGSAGDGLRPRPSSLHPGVVNVFFADGSGRSLAQNIADVVWFNLTTPAGQQFSESIQGDAF